MAAAHAGPQKASTIIPPCHAILAAYRKLAGKELAEDATFELERKRNRPEKYDREVGGSADRRVSKSHSGLFSNVIHFATVMFSISVP